jgi:hypothetical protein
VRQDKVSQINIRLRDTYSNQSEINFSIMPATVMKQVPHLESMSAPVFTDISENTFLTTFKSCPDSTATAMSFSNGQGTVIEPDYFNENRSVFLTDLRKNIPDSIAYCGRSVVTDFKKVVIPGSTYQYSSDFAELDFSENTLYDTLYLTERYSREKDEEVFSIGNRDIPLNKSVKISLKPRLVYDTAAKYAVYRIAGRGHSFIGGDFSNGRITFNTREFGEFTILKDDVQPTIRPMYVDRTAARFKIKDNLSGINSIEAYINGQWVLMHHDAKSSSIWSEKLDKNVPFKGTFELIITDNAGNKSIYTKKIP